MAAASFMKMSPAKLRTPTTRITRSSDTRRSDSYEIEHVEYDWPDLPPLTQVKDAITRNKVSHGISYLLPLDSVSNNFRPDLRHMYGETNRSYDRFLFDNAKSQPSTKVQLFRHSVDTKLSEKYLSALPSNLNAHSEEVRKLYGRSAPRQAAAKRRMGLDCSKSRQRSGLYVTVKAKEPPEAIEMREEVEKIITSLKENDDEYDDAVEDNHSPEGGLETQSTITEAKSNQMYRKRSVFKEADHSASLNAKLEKLKLEQRTFKTYQKLKNATPPKIQIPSMLKSTFLSDEENQTIWEWLHHKEEMSEFDFFLSVCG
ncbi:uncharacterized protein LOC126816661 [Patella vulgata]|uniref:uncharacterized protein LOC126816661 n=1 Tax=Patella vulgata TaxID=6465 RepID=UPI00217F6DF0|nr:uncharacterized protein LOC126816661 [Patella vulgata]